MALQQAAARSVRARQIEWLEQSQGRGVMHELAMGIVG